MTNKNIFIIYPNFYNNNTKSLSVGGVQNYIYNLCKLIQSLGFDSYVIQKSTNNIFVKYSDIYIKGYKIPKHKSPRHFLFYKTLKEFNKHSDIIIFGSENFSVKTKLERVISIQHGIFWDLPINILSSNIIIDNFFPFFKRRYLIKKVIRNFNNCLNKVCVDYNYLNWYRTVSDVKPNENIWVIPNFTKIEPNYCINDIVQKHENDKIIKIIFARRFVEIRGTLLLIEIVKEIVKEHRNLHFTFAGEGPLFNEIKKLKKTCNINIITYDYRNVLEIHKDQHIAIIPSLGSEGTSISVAEAMAVGCTVLATNVGGITNMIVNEYNGLLVNPDKKQIIDKLKSIIGNRDLRIKLAINGFCLAKESFNIEKWNNNWTKLLSFF